MTMAAGIETGNEKVSFDKQLNGYDKEQVDSYVYKLATAYRQAYDEYSDVCDKYNTLLSKYKKVKTAELEDNVSAEAQIITQTLVKAERLAQDIIKDARKTAAEIKADAQSNADAITEQAYIELAKSKIQAKKILEDAYADAVYAKKKRNQAEASVKELADKMQSLLDSDAISSSAGSKPIIPKRVPLSHAKKEFSA